MILYEMRIGYGESLKVTEFYAVDKAAARDRVGRLAAREKCGIDLYYAGAGDLNDRYISTAAPTDQTKRGYRFERITS